MKALRRILTLVIKEFAVVMRDPKSRFVVIAPPIFQFFVFGYAATFDLTNVRYAVLDASRTPASRSLLARFEGSPHFQQVSVLRSEAEARRAIDRQEVRLVLHVRSDFGEDLLAGRPGRLQVILDGRNSNVAAVAAGYVEGIVQAYNAALPPPPGEEAPHPTIQLAERAWFNENLESRWTIVSGLGGIISMVVVVILASLSVAREREFGTFDQLLVSPFRPFEILVGKSVPSLAFGLLDALLLSAGAVFWFGVPFRGSIPALLVALSAFVIAIVGIGLFISAISTTLQQALLGAFLFVMPAVILSGFTTPIRNMPQWLQILTLANPMRHVISALRQIFLVGADTAGVWPQLWPLLVIAGLTLPGAAWMFRHRTT